MSADKEYDTVGMDYQDIFYLKLIKYNYNNKYSRYGTITSI